MNNAPTATRPLIDISEFSADDLLARVGEFAEILHGCVHANASVGFVLPFEIKDARQFWLEIEAALRSGTRRLLALEEDGLVVATAQLNIGQPQNGRHRAEVSKLLVHPACQRRGYGRRLMEEIENMALKAGKSLLVLDTRSGDPSDQLYRRIGFVETGRVPAYARSPDGRLEDCTFFHKVITSPVSSNFSSDVILD